MKKKKITIREIDLPNLKIEILNNNFQPQGTYSLQNLIEKYWR